MIKKLLPVMICWMLSIQWGLAQNTSNQLEILNAETLLGGRGVERLIGDVKMKHQNSLIYCDSAYFYSQDNFAKLFGNVRIVDQKDPITTTSRYAEYDGNTRLAKLRNNVVFKNEETTLYTDFLDYDRLTGVATYFNDGRVVDSTNVLTSEKGVYETQIEKITFTEKVVLVNPDYTLKSRLLYYYTIPKTAETVGVTNIVSAEGNRLNAQISSFYDTQLKTFRFYDGDAESETSLISGDVLFYDELAQYYEAKDNVSIYNKERKTEVFGDEGKYWEDRKYSQVIGNALVRKYFEADTMFMIADTLITQDSEIVEDRYMTAFNGVRFIKGGMSGKADSLTYIYSDSTIYLFKDPLLWNNKSQISADSINFLIANEDIDRTYLKHNTFAITRDTLNNYNQIKGRKMTGFFLNGDMTKLDVEGNGESLYFALERDTLFKGMNKLLCARIIMHFSDGQIQKINHSVKPDASFTPPHIIKKDDQRLEGFAWREDEKPTMAMVLDWRTPRIREKGFNFFDEPDIIIPYPSDDEIQINIEEHHFENTENQAYIP
ncbi:Organic solvent tolerance protein OstA [Anditalea andensis]|uniref:Organic solvent tolerance protein OstA n=1 Tax=Anditalea andensis TaxID=1048983 RepID=A0A074L185_9BACT|nr:Organic solvent tolerance protein OstA [Anditalea andensis]